MGLIVPGGLGNVTVDTFSGDNSTVAFTLSTTPSTINNTYVFISGVYQFKSTYSLSGTTLTFTTAPPTGTSNIQVLSVTVLSIGTPADGTVTTAKLAATTGSGNVVLSASPTLTGTITAAAATLSGLLTVSAGILGTATNNNATAGNVGEYVSNTGTGITSGGTNNYGDICNISLTAGDWDVTGLVNYTGGTSPTYGAAGISTTTGNSATGLTSGDTLCYINPWVVGTNDGTANCPNVRMSLSGTTTVYLKYRTGFSATPTMNGRISARRVR